jgi:hypothetical protein
MLPKPRGHLQRNAAISQAFKIALRASFCRLHHFPKAIRLSPRKTTRDPKSQTNKKDKASSEAEDLGEETDVEDFAESEWDELDDQDFAERLAEMAMADNPNDLDWVPPRLRGKKVKHILHVFTSIDKGLIFI